MDCLRVKRNFGAQVKYKRERIITMKKFLLALLCAIFTISCVACDVQSNSQSEAGIGSEYSSIVEEIPEEERVTVSFVQEGQETVKKYVKKGETLTDIPTPVPVEGYDVEWNVENFENLEKDLEVNAIITTAGKRLLQNFDNVESSRHLGLTEIYSSGGITGETFYLTTGERFLDKCRGNKGKSFAIASEDSTGNAVVTYASLARWGIPEKIDFYFYVYFDSSTAIFSKDVKELPEINETRISKLNYSGGWKFTAQSALAWDAWILVKAESTANEPDIWLTTRNTFEDWDIKPPTFAYKTDATGFSNIVYFDDFFMENSSQVGDRVTVFRDFNNFAEASDLQLDLGLTHIGLTGETIDMYSPITLDKKRGDSGKALGLYAGNNVGDYAVFAGGVFSRWGMTSLTECYFYVYFDSSTVLQGSKIEGLPEITEERIQSLAYSRWEFTALTERAWDTWILVKAVNVQDSDGLWLTARNTYADWGLTPPTGTADSASTGFSCVIYFDDFYVVEEPEEDVPPIDGTVLQNFNAIASSNNLVLTKLNSYAGLTGETIGGVRLDKKRGISGKALAIASGNNVGNDVTVYGSLRAFGLSNGMDFFFYVYFDSTTAAYGDFVELPEITQERIASLEYSGGWEFTAVSEMAWDTWILVKAENVADEMEFYLTTRNTYADWGITPPADISADAASGFSCVVYFDDFHAKNEG